MAGALEEAERGPGQAPAQATRFMPSQNSVGASMVFASPATTLSGPGTASASRADRVGLGDARHEDAVGARVEVRLARSIFDPVKNKKVTYMAIRIKSISC